MTDFIIAFLSSRYSFNGFKYKFKQIDNKTFEAMGHNNNTNEDHWFICEYDPLDKNPFDCIIRSRLW